MTIPTFDLSGLVLLESTIAQMLAADTPVTRTTSPFVGGQSFNVTYSAATVPAGTMTTAALQQRIKALHTGFDRLAI